MSRLRQLAAASLAAVALTTTAATTATAATGNADSAQAQARRMLSATQFNCLSHIVTRESGWNPRAVNASSGAYGLFQALPASKMASAGSDWRTNPATQVRWGVDYMNSRYGSPCGAWAFWQTHHWY